MGQPEHVEAYEPFFGLNEPPFSLAPDPRFLFASATHSAALDQVAYALERREPLVVVTGEIGTGKTLLCRTVLQQLRSKTFLSIISDPLLERDDLLKQLLEDFGVISKDRSRTTTATRHELIQALHAFLHSLVPIHAHAVVVVDEAQHLKPDVLEEIRLLSNVDDERGTLLQIILVGQTDLEPLLARPELRQLQQRVSRRFRLEPLSRDEVEQYITHRLALARDGKIVSRLPGATELARELAELRGTSAGVEFTPDAIHEVTQFSGGLPRVINLLCDRSLEKAFESRVRTIDGPVIQAAARALGVGEQGPPAIAAADVRAPAHRAPPTEPERSFWTVSRAETAPAGDAAQPGDISRPVRFGARPGQAASPRVATSLVLAGSVALVVLAAAAVWFGLRAARAPAAWVPPPLAAPASTPSRAPTTRRDPVQPDAAATPPPKATTTAATPATSPAVTPTPRPAAAPAPPTVAAASADGRFDIVVASFRTDARATSVAAAVAKVGVPFRRRVSDGWQQVVAGPFVSRADAEAAQQRLNRAGITGTQIVPIAR
jgi:general secretion pathway protein A